MKSLEEIRKARNKVSREIGVFTKRANRNEMTGEDWIQYEIRTGRRDALNWVMK